MYKFVIETCISLLYFKINVVWALTRGNCHKFVIETCIILLYSKINVVWALTGGNGPKFYIETSLCLLFKIRVVNHWLGETGMS